MIILLDLEVGIIEAWISLLNPGGADQIGIDFGTRGAQRLGGGSFSSIRLDDVAQVFMAQGVMVEGMLDGGKDLGLTIEIDQVYDLFDLMGQMKLGSGEELQIAVGRIPQGKQSITVLKVSAMGS